MTMAQTRTPAVAEPQYPYMTLAAFHALARTGGTPGEVLLRKAGTIGAVQEIRTAGDGARVIRMAITSERIDREEDTIALDGWELDNYRNNPVVLWAHDYYSLPIARSNRLAIETIQLAGAGGATEAVRVMTSDDEFPAKGVHPFADTVYDLLVGGYLNASSVGFRPLTWSFDEERWGVNFLTHEMLEHSIVPIPANADALIQARSAGIAIEPIGEWAELALSRVNGESGMWVPRSAIEGAFRAAHNGRRSLPGAAVEDDEPTVDEAAGEHVEVTDVTDTNEQAAGGGEAAATGEGTATDAAATGEEHASEGEHDDDEIDLTEEQLRSMLDEHLVQPTQRHLAQRMGRLD